MAAPLQEENHIPVTNPAEDLVVVEPLIDTQVVQNIPAAPLRQSERPKVQPSYLNDYIVGTATVSPTPLSLSLSLHFDFQTLQPSSGTNHPLCHYISCGRFSSKHRSYIAALTMANEPRSFKEAMQTKEWPPAMTCEVTSLEDAHTWDLVDTQCFNPIKILQVHRQSQ
ncbi:hypothetical protein V5N11_009864 [Cardamine amara subsp. amara]|uniref:Uncharacterized protein n=1 Tax=Cardamine amara subsp. amara TaxID=228776 RepID=A0ABD1A9J9_CARAN